MSAPVRIVTAAIAAAALACGGCAQLPDATIHYYLARTTVSFKAVRTVACTADGKLVSATTVTPAVVHAADRTETLTIPLAHLRGRFADGDLKVDLYDDGRLKALNATATGEGEPILKAAMTIVETAAAAAAVPQGALDRNAACDVKAPGRKARTLTYEGEIDVSAPSGAQELTPDPDAEELLETVGGVCAYVEEVTPPATAFAYAREPGDLVIRVRPPGVARVVVRTGNLGAAATRIRRCGKATSRPHSSGGATNTRFRCPGRRSSGSRSSPRRSRNPARSRACNTRAPRAPARRWTRWARRSPV